MMVISTSSFHALVLWLTAAVAPVPHPPAVPLVTHDPFFSIWTTHDALTEGPTQHWSGAEQPLSGLLRVDGKSYRFMGSEPRALPALRQTDVQITPTRTLYSFAGAGMKLEVSFLSPLLPHDLELFARPVSYVEFTLTASDDRQHSIEIYFDAGADLAVNSGWQDVVAERVPHESLTALRIGTREQPVLKRAGDGGRIDWGHAYLAAPRAMVTSSALARGVVARDRFVRRGDVGPDQDDLAGRAMLNDPVLALVMALPAVGRERVSRHVMVAYDQLWAIESMRTRLRPYWRRSGAEPLDLLERAEREHAEIARRARAFDTELQSDMVRVGGPAYAALGALSFRQALAAHVLVADGEGRPLYFSKENNSGGYVATVDVTYPSSPLFLLFNPGLLAAQLEPVLAYSASPRWRHTFAPHDLGLYPQANGQKYGDGETGRENQMPVEESGNMLILCAAYLQASGDVAFVKRHWPRLRKWAAYLARAGLDPDNQLCTDDFAGHLAHNTNLSLKAVIALGAHALLADAAGEPTVAQRQRARAQTMAKQWLERASDDSGHTRLTFDRSGSWSQKYNLVWDGLLGLNLFPDELRQRELAFYASKLNRYGLPLDNRSSYTKLDWQLWIAALSDNREDFARFMEPITRFINETPSRVPLTDWYDSLSARKQGFQARSVVGGVFMPMLRDEQLRKKWAARAVRALTGTTTPG